MEAERYPAPQPSRENPNPNPRPTTSGLILDRFRAMAAVNDDIVEVYEELLSELTFNSKPIITELTMIAGEQREHGQGIANAILARILEVPVDQKLPSLYLLDSIVKNIGCEYVRYFASRLPEVFCEGYNQVHSSMHPAMRHLFRTWSQVFPSSVLHKIEDELQFSLSESQRPAAQVNMRNSESPSPRPSHGIHVNPKYLEARRQLQPSAPMGGVDAQKNVHTAGFEEDGIEIFASESPKGWSGASSKFHDIEHAIGNPSRLRGYGHNSSGKYGDNDFNNHGPVPSHLGRSKTGSQQIAAISTSVNGVERPIHHLNDKVPKPLSPRLLLKRPSSPIDDGLLSDIPPWRSSERSFQPLPRLDRSWPPNFGSSQLEAPTKKHPRELIDAYGNYRGKSTSLENFSKLPRIDTNGINRESTAKNWRSFEEEEYVWEDMSPTLSDRSRRNSLPSLGPTSGSLSRRVGLSQPDANILEPDFRGKILHGQANQHPVDDPALIVDDRIPVLGSGRGTMLMKSSDGKEVQNEQVHHYRSSQHVQEPGKFPRSFQHAPAELSSTSRVWRPQMPFPPSTITSVNDQNQKLPSLYDKPPDFENPYPRLNLQTPFLDKNLELRPSFSPLVHNSQPMPLLPFPPPNQNQFRSAFNLMESSKPVNQGTTPSLFQPHQQFDGGYIPSLSCQFLAPPHIQMQCQGVPMAMGSLPSKVSVTASSEATSLVPPLPAGPPPGSSNAGRASQNTGATSGSSVSAFSGLISTLMAQGIISLTPPAQSEDSVGLEFNSELLKVRHESAINALYTNLPRQCTTCGLRFKCQEEHSNHMDWHVTKNRISKNRKQKPSRKWFVNTKEWLSGAETVGTEVIPFLPTEVITEKKEDKEMAVPADENQTACALCGESFEDFYSDEAEEWMYKGAVYMNAPDGNIGVLDRAQLGPIVHAKCRSDSNGSS